MCDGIFWGILPRWPENRIGFWSRNLSFAWKWEVGFLFGTIYNSLSGWNMKYIILRATPWVINAWFKDRRIVIFKPFWAQWAAPWSPQKSLRNAEIVWTPFVDLIQWNYSGKWKLRCFKKRWFNIPFAVTGTSNRSIGSQHSPTNQGQCIPLYGKAKNSVISLLKVWPIYCPLINTPINNWPIRQISCSFQISLSQIADRRHVPMRVGAFGWQSRYYSRENQLNVSVEVPHLQILEKATKADLALSVCWVTPSSLFLVWSYFTFVLSTADTFIAYFVRILLPTSTCLKNEAGSL